MIVASTFAFTNQKSTNSSNGFSFRFFLPPEVLPSSTSLTWRSCIIRYKYVVIFIGLEVVGLEDLTCEAIAYDIAILQQERHLSEVLFLDKLLHRRLVCLWGLRLLVLMFLLRLALLWFLWLVLLWLILLLCRLNKFRLIDCLNSFLHSYGFYWRLNIVLCWFRRSRNLWLLLLLLSLFLALFWLILACLFVLLLILLSSLSISFSLLGTSVQPLLKIILCELDPLKVVMVVLRYSNLLQGELNLLMSKQRFL